MRSAASLAVDDLEGPNHALTQSRKPPSARGRHRVHGCCACDGCAGCGEYEPRWIAADRTRRQLDGGRHSKRHSACNHSVARKDAAPPGQLNTPLQTGSGASVRPAELIRLDEHIPPLADHVRRSE